VIRSTPSASRGCDGCRTEHHGPRRRPRDAAEDAPGDRLEARRAGEDRSPQGRLRHRQAGPANLRAVTNNQTASGEKESTGLLAKSIVVTRGKAPTTGNGERYLVRVKGKTYARKGKVVTTKKTAQLLEYGSSKQPAEPWLRPAFASKATEAINTVVRELPKEIDKAAQKYLNKRK
jgi:hypothetical protein